MGIKPGTYLGGIRCVEDLRLRSHVDEITGCWHCRIGLRKGISYVCLQLDGRNVKMSGRRAALLLSGVDPKPGQVAFATDTCEGRDCVNPEHARWGDTAARMQWLGRQGVFSTPERCAHLARANKHRAKLTDEQRLEVRTSSEQCKVLAERLGVTPSLISQTRNRRSSRPAISVFGWRP